MMAAEHALAAVAAAIAEPARARMLCALLDGRARTATELCAVGDVSASTTSAHLARLVEHELVQCVVQGRHRYYALRGPEVGAALESLLVVVGRRDDAPVTRTPPALRDARTCYDHLAGTLAVELLEHMLARRWLQPETGGAYALSPAGRTAFDTWGVDVDAAQATRRRFACACLDWSERKPHLAGALGAALFDSAKRRRWLTQDLDGRGVQCTAKGRREWLAPLGL